MMMKPYTIPYTQNVQKNKTVKGLIVPGGNEADAVERAEKMQTADLALSQAHRSTVNELRYSDINGKQLPNYKQEYIFTGKRL